MKFNTRYSEHKPVYCDPGSPIKDEYQLRVVDNENILVKTGKSNLFEYIQSHADSVDIHKILERCAMLDDYSILNRVPSEFMDVTDLPTTLAEAYSQIRDAENFFDLMPVDIKEKYNNNIIEFLHDIGSDNFNRNVSDYLDSIRKEEVKEENVNES